MTSWTAGYVTDVAYTAGYFNELNPTRLPLGLLNAGYAPPKVENACELGFGQGVSIAMHAAAQPNVNWYGDDFNPSQAAFANWMVDAAGVKATLTDQSFAEFCSRQDLPDFDFIALHGIWSWISDENREIIVDFLRRKLRVGGVAYISYNVLPGWAAAMPLRDLMARHGDIMGSAGQSSLTKMDNALGFADRMFELDPAYVRQNSEIAARYAQLKTLPKPYLAHEYLNRDWRPMYFTEIADILSTAKLEFACSAATSDAVEEAHLSEGQRAFLAEIEDEAFREMIRDYFTNAQFRRDYWIKGGRILSQSERIDEIRKLRVALVVPRALVPATVKTALGEVTLQPAVYDPILEVLSDHRARSIEQLEAEVAAKGVEFLQVVQAVMLLTGLGAFGLAQSDSEIEAGRRTTRALNAMLTKRSHYSDQVATLASPVTGGGLTISRFDQLFLTAHNNGQKNSDQWADYAWSVIKGQGETLLRDGEALTTDEENLADLRGFAARFEEGVLPLIKALGMADAQTPHSRQKSR